MTSKHQQLVDTLQHSRIVNLELGRLLMEIREGERYREEIGEGINTWYDYLSQPEVGMSVTEANALIRLYQFCSTHKLHNDIVARIPTPSMRHLVKKATTLPTEEILEAGATLSPRDFKERYYDHATEDKGTRSYTYMVMRRCNETNNLTKIHEVESEEVLNAFKEKIDG